MPTPTKSHPDLEALDANWDEPDEEEDDDDEQEDVDALDAGWGDGPRRHRTAAEIAEARKKKLAAKAERRRLRLEANAQKQKKKKPRTTQPPRPSRETSRKSANIENVREANEEASVPIKRATPSRARSWKTMLIAVALIIAIAAIVFFVMTHAL